jgi:hypothetical protein
VRVSNNYIKTNGNADFALIYNNAYNIQEFNNKIVGSGAIGKIKTGLMMQVSTLLVANH